MSDYAFNLYMLQFVLSRVQTILLNLIITAVFIQQNIFYDPPPPQQPPLFCCCGCCSSTIKTFFRLPFPFSTTPSLGSLFPCLSNISENKRKQLIRETQMSILLMLNYLGTGTRRNSRALMKSNLGSAKYFFGRSFTKLLEGGP